MADPKDITQLKHSLDVTQIEVLCNETSLLLESLQDTSTLG